MTTEAGGERIDLEAIKARLAAWRQLKMRACYGEVQYERVPTLGRCVTARRTGALLAVTYAAGVGDFLVHAHNTPIEDDLEALLAELEAQRGES